MTKRVRDRCDAILRVARQATSKGGTFAMSGVFAFNAARMVQLLGGAYTYDQVRYALLEMVNKELRKSGSIYSYTRRKP